MNPPEIKPDERRSFGIRDGGTIESVTQFVKVLFDLRGGLNDRKLLFRGQPCNSEEYKLKPSIGRQHKYAGRSKLFEPVDEINLLHRFRRRSYPHVGGHLKAGEALFLARHHGLPTRLLDWTANALFGLYFACCEMDKIDQEGTVTAILPSREPALDPYDIAEIERESGIQDAYSPDGRTKIEAGDTTDAYVKIVDPIFSSPRIVAQDSSFTLHSDPKIPLEELAGVIFWRQRLDIELMTRWRISPDAKRKAISELSGLGIVHRSVFPDLDGIARSIWETEVLWKGEG